jgi:hypothetical protein
LNRVARDRVNHYLKPHQPSLPPGPPRHRTYPGEQLP